MPAPDSHAGVLDLTDAEFAELDELLAATPEPLEPLDACMLDGYLAGLLVQPVPLTAEQWLPPIFDAEARPLPADADPAWRERLVALVMRRHDALNRAMVEHGWFDPYILELDDYDPPRTDDPAASLNPVSQALLPWVAGFHQALERFPALVEMQDDAVHVALARLYRHLPVDSAEEREIVRTLDREHPLPTLDDAIDDLVVIVADLADLTRDQRYKVDQVRREAPKVGRNDPCPCGSGRKFKQCHGKG